MIGITLEGILKIKDDKELIAVVDNSGRSQKFYICKEAGTEEIKSLLELISQNCNPK